MEKIAVRRELAQNSQEQFYAFLRTLPQDTQEFVSDLSSMVLELDLQRRTVLSENEVLSIKNDLIKHGVKRNQVGRILSFVGLPNPRSHKSHK